VTASQRDDSPIQLVDVVIPARNEEALIGACLESVAEAARFVREVRPGGLPDIRITVVADSCTDSTAEIVAGYGGVGLEQLEVAAVGSARAHGVRTAMRTTRVDPARHWIANTDADSVVPPNWLAHQLLLAESGFTLVIGTVRPEMGELTEAQRDAWHQRHIPGRPNGHVHGANLGFRADLYYEAGGFHEQSEHEDNDLVDRMLALGAESVATDASEVVTSGRRFGRTPGGYAGYLRQLDSDASASPTGGRSNMERWKA
jgi:glycosyltransferase involved in cell wall biosynthesis